MLSKDEKQRSLIRLGVLILGSIATALLTAAWLPAFGTSCEEEETNGLRKLRKP